MSITDDLCGLAALNMTEAAPAFLNVFPTVDGSVLRGVQACVLARHLRSTVLPVLGVADPAAVRQMSDRALYEMLMLASLSLFANHNHPVEPWARVRFDPAANELMLAPTSTATRQLFADVIVVLSVLALVWTWLQRS
jgi:hypothetical protein